MTPAQLHKLYGWIILGVVAVALVLGIMQRERHAGAVAVLTKQSAAQLDTANHRADSTHRDALQATADAAKLRHQARAEVKRDSLARLVDDSIHRVSADERQRAAKLLADSLATLAQLRGQLGRLIATSRADSVSSQQERVASQRTIASLLATVAADSTAIAKGLSAYTQQLAATNVATKEVALLKSQAPSFLGRHLSLTAGYGCTVKDQAACGPAVVAGWKILP